MKSLEKAIQEARRKCKLTQMEVADELSVARTTVSNWECGRSQPDYLTLRKLSRILHCDLFSSYRDDASVQEAKIRKLASFSKRMREAYELSEESCLDSPTVAADEDNADLLEAVPANEFDDETRLTISQMNRIRSSEIDSNVKHILDSLLNGTRILTGKEYYEGLSEGQRKKIKDAFKALFLVHLRRERLTTPEQTILSTAIPILLWHIQGKTFKEILALR